MSRVKAMSIKTTSIPIKKRRLAYPIAAIGVIIVLVLAGVFYLGVLGLRVDGYLKQGLIHYNKGGNLIKKSITAAADLRLVTDKKEREKASRNVSESITQAKHEFDLAARSFKEVRRLSMLDREKEAAILLNRSTAEAKESADGVFAVVEMAEKMADVLVKVSDGAATFQQAVNQSNILISLNNSGRYAEVKSAVPQLASLYANAKAMIIGAGEMDSKAELAAYLDQIAMGEKLAENLGKMADEGLISRVNEYNRLSDESNALIAQLMEVSQSKLVADPAGWAADRLKGVIGKVKNHAKKADKYKTKALDLLSKNT